jgi:Trypsin
LDAAEIAGEIAVSTQHLKSIATTTILLLLAGCNSEGFGFEEIGGSIASQPPVVALVAPNGSAFCTGVLVSEIKVLTAGHCIDELSPTEVSVFFGNEIGTGEGRFVAAVELVTAETFDPATLQDDLGVLTLSQPVTDVAPAQFISEDVTAADIGSKLLFVGFGRGNLDDNLKTTAEVTLRAVTADRLMYLWRGNESLPSAIPEFEAGDCTRGAGSPTFLIRDGEPLLMGINSYSSDDCEAFGVNRKVSVPSVVHFDFLG